MAVQFGEGILLEVNDGASNAYATVTELTSVTPPGETTKRVERKRLSVTGLVEKLPSPRVDRGEVPFSFEFDATLMIRLRALRGLKNHTSGGAAVAWRVTYPDGYRVVFEGFLADVKPDAVSDPEAILTGSGMIVVCGALASFVVSDTSP